MEEIAEPLSFIKAQWRYMSYGAVHVEWPMFSIIIEIVFVMPFPCFSEYLVIRTGCKFRQTLKTEHYELEYFSCLLN